MLMDLFFAPFKPRQNDGFIFTPSCRTFTDGCTRRESARAGCHRTGRKGLASEARLLCLDEMQVTDIADAMIVGRLFEGLLAAAAVIVTTSNLPPTGLYQDGLNRQLFVPFIKLIEERLEVVSLDSATDYRLGRVKAHETFLTPLNAENDARLQDLWRKLTDSEMGESIELSVSAGNCMCRGRPWLRTFQLRRALREATRPARLPGHRPQLPHRLRDPYSGAGARAPQRGQAFRAVDRHTLRRARSGSPRPPRKLRTASMQQVTTALSSAGPFRG